MTTNLSIDKPQSAADVPVGVALVGCGYWGPNLIRNFVACPGAKLVAVCDRDPERLRRVAPLCPGARLLTDVAEALQDDAVEALVVATPPATHGPIARLALQAGRHVLVEKPLATSVRDAEDLVHLAARKSLTLMVDHTFLYSPAVQKIKELIDDGTLGDIWYVDCVRINLGLFQSDVNVLWDLASHDLAIVDYLLERLPFSIAAFGASHTGNDLEDVAYLNLDFGAGLLASFHVNWLSPVKVRHLIIGGSKKGLIYNDLDPSEPIKVYDRGITLSEQPEDRRGLLINYRVGDVWSPQVGKQEPLQKVAAHFTDCIRSGSSPLTDGSAGLRIVRILDLAQRSLNAQGGRLFFHRNSSQAA